MTHHSKGLVLDFHVRESGIILILEQLLNVSWDISPLIAQAWGFIPTKAKHLICCGHHVVCLILKLRLLSTS